MRWLALQSPTLRRAGRGSGMQRTVIMLGTALVLQLRGLLLARPEEYTQCPDVPNDRSETADAGPQRPCVGARATGRGRPPMLAGPDSRAAPARQGPWSGPSPPRARPGAQHAPNGTMQWHQAAPSTPRRANPGHKP